MLRLAGLDGADDDGMPWVNRLADAVRGSAGLEHGVALPVWDAHADRRLPRPGRAGPGRGRRAGSQFRMPEGDDGRGRRTAARRAALARGIAAIDARRAERDADDRETSATRRSRGST